MTQTERFVLITKLEGYAFLAAWTIIIIHWGWTGTDLMHAGMLKMFPRKYDIIILPCVMIVLRIVHGNQTYHHINPKWVECFIWLAAAFGLGFGSLYALSVVPVVLCCAFCIVKFSDS